MAAPPYSYGGGGQYRNAVLNQMQEDPYAPNDDYRYPTNPLQGRAPTGQGAAITSSVGALAPTVAKQFAPQVASSLVEGGVRGATSTLGSAAGPIGIGTEIVGSALKPKVQAATPSPYGDLTDQYSRREEGSGEGIAGGAVKWGGRGLQAGSYFGPVGTVVGGVGGALGGAIAGAFNKNAASAYSDFNRRDAEQAIREMYKTRGGRDVTPEELNRILVGAGTKPGDQFVGEKGLYSILQSLDQNFAQERIADPNAEAAQAVGASPRTAMPEGTAVARSALDGNDGAYGAPANTTAGTPADATTPPADATTPPAQDTTKWDTDGYAKPAYTAANPAKTAPPGWSNEKWNNPNHQTPKYVIGRILSQFPPRTENVDAAVAEINKAFPGTTRVSNGDIKVPGLGVIDVLQAADVGGKAWHFGTGGGKGSTKGKASSGSGSAGAPGITSYAGGYDSSGDVSGGSTIQDIIRRIQGISGGKKPGVLSARDAVLNQF